jgi:hypothetical protein
MATYSQTITRFNDRVIGIVEQADDLAVNAASTVSEKLGDMLPNRLPGADYIRSLPKPEEYVRLYFDLVERLVRTQKTFSLNMVKAFHPITGKIWPAQVRKAA